MTLALLRALALVLPLALVPAPAAADAPEHPVALRYVAVTESCRVTISIEHERRLDPSTPLEMVILVEGLWPDPYGDLYRARCGPYTGGVYCDDVVGSVAEGFSCTWGTNGWYTASVGGAPSGHGAFASTLTYLGRELPAVGVVLHR